MRDLTILGQTALVIIGGVCLAFGLVAYCWLTGSDDPLDEYPDGDWPSVPPGLAGSSLHAAPLADERTQHHVL